MGTGRPRERLIEWTGERCVPWADDVQMIYEHYHRYAFALPFVQGKRVLDLASGEGYGCALMAARASAVVGLEIDRDSVEHARHRYPIEGVSFEVGSITDPQALDGVQPFDVITCFEAVEHVAEQDRMLDLVRNRLAPGGLFFCSTPDVAVYTHEHGNDNPYHVHELGDPEFRAMLGSRFHHVLVLKQNVAVGSLIHGDHAGFGARVATVRRGADEDWLVAEGAPHTYLVAVASDEPLDVASTSVLVDPDLALLRDSVAAEQERSKAVAQHLADELAGAQDSARNLAEELRQARALAVESAAELGEIGERMEQVAAERDEAVQLAERAREENRRAADELGRSRRRADRDTARLAWLSEANARLNKAVYNLTAENHRLLAEQSARALQLVGRYRGMVERVAPRGTRRRDAYERAMGRPAGVPAPVADSADPVAVTTSERPSVSVIIPTYGQWEYTRRCLMSVQHNLPATPFEVVVVDDAAPDDSGDRAARCPGVRLVRTRRNLGFVGACNLGAEQARGELLLFLNNDTEVRSGWLDSLVDLLDASPDIGLAGAKLVYPDGRLQECGGIVWADGTGWNYGRGADPGQPEFRTVRDVDYCSGAAIMVRRALFEGIGGFDQRYAPAYYEDTDLAFAVRAAGYRTVVQPESVVVHHEGISNGTDLASGVKRHQEINRALFVEKWASELSGHLPEAGARNVWLGRHRSRSGHRGGLVLVADHQVPRPDEDSGSVRMARLLDLLVELEQRVVFFPMNHAWPEEYTLRLHRAGVTVVADAGRQAEFLRDAGRDLSFAILSRPDVAWRLMEPLREHAPDCLVAYDTVDLHFLRLQRQADLAETLGALGEASALRRRARVVRELELGLTRTADVTFTVSSFERELLAKEVPSGRVEVLSNVHHADPLQALPDGRDGILFVGGFDHHPNRDAAHWLVTEIMPLVRKLRPEAVAHIVGSNPPDAVRALDGATAVVHGWVADLDPLYRRSRVVAAPLRFGAGVKGKVGESLCLGVPVVGTSIASEGMDLRHGRDVLIGESPAELADHIAALLEDDQLWLRISEGGKAAVSRLFGPDRARNTLSEFITLSRSE